MCMVKAEYFCVKHFREISERNVKFSLIERRPNKINRTYNCRRQPGQSRDIEI